jgi:hypothetical protein
MRGTTLLTIARWIRHPRSTMDDHAIGHRGDPCRCNRLGPLLILRDVEGSFVRAGIGEDSDRRGNGCGCRFLVSAR